MDSIQIVRDSAKKFTETELIPNVEQWELDGVFSKELYTKAYDAGLLGIGFSENVGGMGGNTFHSLAIIEELAKATSGGVMAGLFSLHIALPPVIASKNHELIETYAKPVLTGEKIAALAITEPDYGSDVANISTRAEKSDDAYTVNGNKTFITSGTRADFITTAVRTGGPGAKGISLLLVENRFPGFSVSRSLKKMGWHASDTAELNFNNCKVPVKNLIGKENGGFYSIMNLFDRERLTLSAMAYASGFVALELAKEHAKQRKAFGEPIINKQSIRHRLAEMETRLTSAKAMTYWATDLYEKGELCSREIAMTKNTAIAAGEFAAYHAVQILGGMGYMQECAVERIYRDMRILALGGGTTEIMREIISKPYHQN